MKKTLALLAAVACAGAMSASAAIIETTTADTRVRNDGNLSTTALLVEVGGHGAASSGFISSFVMPFQLPTLGAGESFGNVTLSFTLEQVGTGISAGEEADLYGLDRINASDAAIAGDYFSGELDGSNTLLQDAILDGSSSLGAATWTDAGGSTALTSWLNTQYAGGANAGDFVFLRLSINKATASAAERFRIQSADSGLPATITYDIIPEPATLGLVAVFGGGVLFIRRRFTI